MAVRPFHEVLAAEGLDLGLEPDILEFIKDETMEGKSLDELHNNETISRASLDPRHLLQIRSAAWRFERMESEAKKLPAEYPIRNVLELQALRWAAKASQGHPIALGDIFAAATATAASILSHGRARIHMLRPQDPLSDEFSDLAEHTEALDDFPPHRWFKASRGVSAGLLWLEVIVDELDIASFLRPEFDRKLLSEMRRAMEKPVLDTIAEAAQKKVIGQAAQALLSMLSIPPTRGPVAGLLMDGKHAFAAIVDDEFKAIHKRTDARELDKLVAWLSENDTRSVALARIGTKGSLRGIMGLLQKNVIPSEPANFSGVMKQARDLAGPIKQAAAEVLARRHKDPVRGTEGIEADELGLGEYLDRVDQDFLRFALTDARKAAMLLLAQKSETSFAKVTGSLNPMVRTICDLRAGMELGGVVLNLTHFGAFVDLGLEQQGLVHISEISDSRIHHPSEVLRVGQQVRVTVLQVDEQRARISLSMKSKGKDSRHSKVKTRSHALKALDNLFNK